MSQTWIRVGGGLIAAVIATIVGIVSVGGFASANEIDPVSGGNITGANSFALILAVAMIIGFVVYAAIEYAQTRRLDSISRQFDTRTIVLMPLAIAFNIIMGQAVATALKVPIYLDSIGTILVGALAGPIPGALTGFLSNLIWSYVVPPPLNGPTAGAFAVVAAIIGLLAGIYGRLGWFRPRPNTPTRQLVVGGGLAIGLIVLLAYLAYLGYTWIMGDASLLPTGDNPMLLVLGWLAIALVVGTIVGLILLLAVKRDLTAAYVVLMGVLTGLVAAAVSAPISANVFGGVTGAGTDFLVLAFRQAGSDIQAATLGQGFISDPIDKVTTFFVVYIILGAMAVRTKARFPQGEYLMERPIESGDRRLSATADLGKRLLLPDYLQPPPASAFHGLNPLTKIMLATVTAVDAVIIGGLLGPGLLIVFAVLLPAAYAGVLPRLVRTTVLLSLPIAISVLIVNVFFFPGGRDVLVTLGPISATREGLTFAIETLVRIAAISGAITLFYLTTRPPDLVLDLERRGVSSRLGFVVSASVQMVPEMVERARSISSAQRARGLDTEGGVRARLRGILPIVGPVVLGAIGEVEERTMALEARGFSRPGRRTLLWAPADSTAQRVARWLLVLTIPGLLAMGATGLLAGLA